MKEIKVHDEVIIYLAELSDVLIEKEYFSFYETSAQYIEDLANFIRANIETVLHKTAPSYFAKYGNNLFYIPYKRNKQTTWYIFFEQTPNHFFIRYITNNHVEGQYF